MRRSNSAARWQARRRSRVIPSGAAAAANAWTAGNRPGVARALGFEDEPRQSAATDHDIDACMTFGCEICRSFEDDQEDF